MGLIRICLYTNILRMIRVYPYTEIYHTRYTKKISESVSIKPSKNHHQQPKAQPPPGPPTLPFKLLRDPPNQMYPKGQKKPYFLDFTLPHPPDRNSTSAIPQLLLTRFWDQQQQQQNNNNNINYKISASTHPLTAC